MGNDLWYNHILGNALSRPSYSLRGHRGGSEALLVDFKALAAASRIRKVASEALKAFEALPLSLRPSLKSIQLKFAPRD